MPDQKPLDVEDKIDQLLAICAAISAFVCEMPEAKLVEMPKLKAVLQAHSGLTEHQKKLAVDAAREMKHAVQGKAGH